MAPVADDFTVRFFDLDAVVVDEDLLSASERERVARKATAALRQRQAASFHCLRVTLGEVLQLAPTAVPIGIAEEGKPFLQAKAAKSRREALCRLRFNLSHSDGVGMLAWGMREVGCDVEHLITRPSDGLAGEILTPRELEAWLALPEGLRQDWLTRAWVRKESTLKAVGSGLRIPPRTIDVGGGANNGERWSVDAGGRRWVGIDCVDGVPEGYRAAVCIEHELWFVYVLRCAGDRLYCGIAKNVEARFAEHAAGKGAKFTRAFPPDEILATCKFEDRAAALRAEAGFKRMTRAEKLGQIDVWSS